MPAIDVHTVFKLNLGTRIVPFAKGRHEDVSEEVADHFYTKIHATVVPPEPEAVPVIEPVADTPDVGKATSDKDALRARAEVLGIVVDKRWGVSRLNAEIAAHEAPVGADAATEPEEQADAE